MLNFLSAREKKSANTEPTEITEKKKRANFIHFVVLFSVSSVSSVLRSSEAHPGDSTAGGTLAYRGRNSSVWVANSGYAPAPNS